MFNWLVQPCLEFIRLQCKFVVQTSPTHLAFSMMRLYSSLLGERSQMGAGGALAISSAHTVIPPSYRQIGILRWNKQAFGVESRVWWKESTYFGFSLDLRLIFWMNLCKLHISSQFHKGSDNSCLST